MIKRGVMRMDPTKRLWVADPDGVQLTLLGLWLARFGDDWRYRYTSTWAIAFGRGPTYFYFPAPKEEHHA